MKLRLTSNSIRFRFDQNEVAVLSRGEMLEECVQVGPDIANRFTYRIVPDPNLPESSRIEARFFAGALTVLVSPHAIAEWSSGPELSLTGEEVWGENKLTVLLEKDLLRLNAKSPGEAPGSFPNPRYGKVRCDHP